MGRSGFAGGADDRDLRRARRLRSGRRRRSFARRRNRERAREVLALDRSGVGRQRGVAAGRRRHALLRVSRALRVRFSGFYLPLMMVLWLLILRGISDRVPRSSCEPVWTPLWDVVFCARASAGGLFRRRAGQRGARRAARRNGYFFVPLWTRLAEPFDGILDWYTVIVGVVALTVLMLHGESLGPA